MSIFLSMIFGIAFARDAVVAIQSDSLEEYSVPAKAFEKHFEGKVQTFSLHGKKSTALKLAADLKRDPPPLIIAIGAKAAWIARRELPDIPMIYTMVNNPRRYGIKGENVLGIRMNPEPELTLSQLQLFAPSIKSIAFFTSRFSDSDMLTQATLTCNSLGLKPIRIEVETTQDLRRELAKLPEKADALWLLPDHRIVTPENFYHISNTAMRARMPSISTSRNLTRAGALFSVSANKRGVGKQAAQLATEILAGNDSKLGLEIPPTETHVALNRDTQQAIGMTIEDFLMDFITEIVQQD